MAPPALRQVASIVCRYAARGSQASKVLSRSIEVNPLPLSRARPTVQGMYEPPRVQGSASTKNYFSQIKVGKECPGKIGSRATFDQHTGGAACLKSTRIQESVACGQMQIYWTTLANALKLSWQVLVNALKEFLKSKFPKSKGSYFLGIVDRISTEALEGGWQWVRNKVHKASSAAFWAATGLIFNSMRTTGDKTITLQLPGTMEDKDKTEAGESQVLTVVQDALQKLAQQQADGLAEGFDNMQKIQSSEWKLMRRELSMFCVRVEARLLKGMEAKSLVIRDVVNPDHYVPPITESTKSDSK